MCKPQFTDAKYLREDQYRDDVNFNTRFELHERFSINKHGFYRWVFDQLDLPKQCTILELGSGPGYFWLKNKDRLPIEWDITVSDFSTGMLFAARHNLNMLAFPIKFAVIDVQTIPFANESVDVVLANHMLYHVPNRIRAFSEIQRVLKHGGRLYATTNGHNHLRELGELIMRFNADSGENARENSHSIFASKNFCLENGVDQLSPWFSSINIRRYDDALVITEVEAILNWVNSCIMDDLRSIRLEELTEFLRKEIKAKGHFHISKDTVIFEAIR